MAKQFKVGDSAELEHTITTEDVKRFVDISGDDNPLHVSREFAARTSLKSPVAHGMLTGAFISTIIGKKIPGDGALWLSQTLEFLLPVRVGDTIRVCACVTQVHDSQSLLDLEVVVFNQHKQKVVTGKSRVKLLEVEQNQECQEIQSDATQAVLIAGGSRGIGADTAIYLSSLGWKVAIGYRSDKSAAEAVVAKILESGGDGFIVQGDLKVQQTADDWVSACMDRWQGLSGIVACASDRLIPRPFAQTNEDEWRDAMDIHYFANLRLARAAIKVYQQQKKGSMVALSSTATHGLPPQQMLAYTAAKEALESAMKSLAVEYGPTGLRFNLVSPGMTDTALVADVPEKTRLLIKMQTPTRRLAKTRDIAQTIAFLLSEEASHITGQNIKVCGGIVME